MYVARFSYAIRPVDRDPVLALLHHEVEAARANGQETRLLVPLTRVSGDAALPVPTLDALDAFREAGVGGETETRSWARELSEYLLEPPAVELLRISVPSATSNT